MRINVNVLLMDDDLINIELGKLSRLTITLQKFPFTM